MFLSKSQLDLVLLGTYKVYLFTLFVHFIVYLTVSELVSVLYLFIYVLVLGYMRILKLVKVTVRFELLLCLFTFI